MANLPQETLRAVILQTLDRDGTIPDTRHLKLTDGSVVGAASERQLAIKGALDSLTDKEMVTYRIENIDHWSLTPEGSQIAEQGSPEFVLWSTLGDGGVGLKELQTTLGAELLKIGQANAFRRKWVAKDGDSLKRVAPSISDITRSELVVVRDTGTHPDPKILADCKRRTLCVAKKLPYYIVAKGPKFSTEVTKVETDLTAELLQSGAWESATFKQYNFAAEGAPPAAGALHPLLRVREEFRSIFFEMGFSEMPTNRFVESSFWNFDALFVPQQHPARELQDTFYIKDPSTSDSFPHDYMKRVRAAHENGGDCGSTGYQYDWKQSEAERLVLRTHTTAVSAAMLYEAAQAPGGFKPCKLFSIDRVFRNEAVDATHLAEFHQVEGVVADLNITLGDLIGFMEIFFSKMGITNLRFKPAYNPYTEPSLEIFSYHQGLKKWVEIGNSGMFRPEMLEPMGLPKDVRALGWGLSVERPTMIKYGLSNIRDLVGHKVPLSMVETAAAVRF